MADDLDLITQIEGHVNDFDEAMSEWSAEAWHTYDFINGRQYTYEEEQLLKAQLKPVVVFNFLDKFLSAVSGTEMSNEMNVRYHPSSVSHTGEVEVVQQVTHTLLDDDFDLEHSEAFIDTLTCGYGWLCSSVDDSEGEYKIKEERVDPFEMGWDPNARRNNLNDAAWRFRRVYMNLDEIEARWPDKVDELKFGGISEGNTKFSPSVDRGDYRGYGVRDYKDQVALIHYQWRTFERWMRFKAGGSIQEVQEKRFKGVVQKLEEMGAVVEEVGTYSKARFQQTYYCRGILLEEPSDINGFHYTCATGKRDNIKAYFYGIVRYGIDPQKWVNKFLANLIHIMSTSGKGIFIEKGAIAPKDISDFEENFSRADKVKWVADGAISGGRFRLPDQTPLPSGLPDLLSFANSAINNTLGINLELLGMAGRTQSGVVESSRKKAGLTVLARAFSSRRNQIKEIGRLRLDFMRNYIPKEVVISLVDPVYRDSTEVQDWLFFKSYNIKVDEAPSSADVKQDVWAIIVELIPYLMNQKLPPMFLVELLKYSPLPSHITEKLEQIINQPDPRAQEAAQLATEKAKADVGETKTKAMLNVAKAQATGQSSGKEDVEARSEQMNRVLELFKGRQDMTHKEREHQFKMREMGAKALFSRMDQEAKNERE